MNGYMAVIINLFPESRRELVKPPFDWSIQPSIYPLQAFKSLNLPILLKASQESLIQTHGVYKMSDFDLFETNI